MSRYRTSVLCFFAFAFSLSCVRAQEDCHVSFEGNRYDLSALRGEHFVPRKRESPPTTMTDNLMFDLCGELKWNDDSPSHDQCPRGTSACLITVNTKESDSVPDRVVAVIPVGQVVHEPTYTVLKSPTGLRITRTGASWPTSNSNPQTFVINLFCEPGTEGAPQFKSYEDNIATVEWTHLAACPVGRDSPPGQDVEKPAQPDGKSVGSGLGWFFLVLLLAFVAYFALGAYYNYATYGAVGFDLIPHRDFWREVPYMLQDVFSHLCSSFRPRHGSGREGYIAV